MANTKFRIMSRNSSGRQGECKDINDKPYRFDTEAEALAKMNSWRKPDGGWGGFGGIHRWVEPVSSCGCPGGEYACGRCDENDDNQEEE